MKKNEHWGVKKFKTSEEVPSNLVTRQDLIDMFPHVPERTLKHILSGQKIFAVARQGNTFFFDRKRVLDLKKEMDERRNMTPVKWEHTGSIL